ncbi:MAG TPA: beta-ketoacyl synthase N-terminal-like domain-containing protein [Rhodopila sp.]|jgi:3-oxoacyl-[acyl-carrier-protein] synthase II|nr:beta-ketoacyl synthase N-terminal-like domain-containing protein [Rhodopila sp.]
MNVRTMNAPAMGAPALNAPAMSAPTLNAMVSIRSLGVVSALGVGDREFAAALRAGRQGALAPLREDMCAGAPPSRPARWIADFKAESYLGRKGLAALDRTTRLSLVATLQALDCAGLTVTDENRSGIGVVLGTAAGGVKSISDFIRETYTAPAPHMVSPLQFPNTVMNCAASRCAIWHGLHGANSTVCAGDLSGLAALRYAALLLRLGHAGTLLTGAVEEYCDYTAWAHEALADETAAPLGEGAVVFTMTPWQPERERLADILALRLKLPTRGDTTGALRREIGRALAAAGVTPGELGWWLGMRSGDARGGDTRGGDTGGNEAAAVRAALGASFDDLQRIPPVLANLGDTASASFAFQLAGALALAEPGPGLLTAITDDGQIGVAIVRVLPQAASRFALLPGTEHR